MSRMQTATPIAEAISPRDLQTAYLSAASTFTIASIYAQLVATQATLDVSMTDAGLAQTVSAYQARTKAAAAAVDDRLLPQLIALIADGDNLTHLATGALDRERTLLLTAIDRPADRQQAALLAASVGDQAGAARVDAQTLVGRLSVLTADLDAVIGPYQSALTAAVAALDADARAATAQAETLQAAIQQNIDDIVTGGVELGQGITELGIGALTTVQPGLGGAKASADGEKKDEAKDDSSEMPDAKFVVDAIQAASGGVAKSSAALRALTANNARLAAAYQAIATADGLAATASAIGAQNTLFVDAIRRASADATRLCDAWQQVSDGFAEYSARADGVTDHASAVALTSPIVIARTEWHALNGELQLVRRSLVATPSVGTP